MCLQKKKKKVVQLYLLHSSTKKTGEVTKNSNNAILNASTIARSAVCFPIFCPSYILYILLLYKKQHGQKMMRKKGKHTGFSVLHSLSGTMHTTLVFDIHDDERSVVVAMPRAEDCCCCCCTRSQTQQNTTGRPCVHPTERRTECRATERTAGRQGKDPNPCPSALTGICKSSRPALSVERLLCRSAPSFTACCISSQPP